MRWTTREHWLWGIALPGRFYLLSLSLATLISLTPWSWKWHAAILLSTLGGLGISSILYRWRAFSISFPSGGRVLLEQNGLVMIAERRINLGMVGSMTFRQTLMGRLLDYGSLPVGALGGPYEWENLGQFRTLRRIIESQGEWRPPTRGVIFDIFSNWIRQLIQLVSQVLMNLRQIINDLKSEGRIIVEYFRIPSYRRFLEFAEKILFTKNSRRYESWIPMASLRDSTFREDEIEIYKSILRMRRLIVSDLQGRTFRHKRIQIPKDIRRYIPVSWFRNAIRTI